MRKIKGFRYAVTLGAAALALSGTAVSAMAASSPAVPAAKTATADTSAAARSYTYLTFKKNAGNPSNSRLSLVYVNMVNPDHPHSSTVDSWRAGSGSGSTNTCARNQGWLPNGEYGIRAFYSNHNGGAHGVNGVSWLLSDHKCHNGTWRTDLFIHSEMRPNGTQGPSTGGDSPYRWDGNGDYKSNGCIKLKPADIRQLMGYRANLPKPIKLFVS
ncbi:hypothetical protein N4G70_12305 [Streptomyces sp. ASQP_92]|uniref:hypothetical protein n=1 Tax=Streptomyces sp. ASQP_92 TaxID=2979116 RepID=UPI0021C11A00|nr:hypothetical protein [Streptomyces sp. ASQP_92]MCT9089654.1 hypothetical protein [Streptomyces sp. ASQP_92]